MTDRAETMNPVINVREQNIDNRLSELQTAILDYLVQAGRPEGGRIGHLPRTGDVVDALGRSRNKAGFASVARALRRLSERGLVDAYAAEICTRGNGFYWARRHD